MRAGRPATASLVRIAISLEAAPVAIFYVPVIAAEDWEAMKKLIRPCPAATHDAWLAFQAKEIAEIRASRHNAKLVDVSAADYARYLAARRGRRDIERLRGYVFEKATGKR